MRSTTPDPDCLVRHYRLVMRVATGLVGPEDADDVAQEVLLHAVRGLPEMNEPASIKGWLYSIAVNTCVDHRRRKAHHDSHVESLSDPSEIRSPERADEVEAADLRAWARLAISRLPQPLVEVAMLRSNGMSVADIVETTWLSFATVSSRLHRARAILREQLADRV